MPPAPSSSSSSKAASGPPSASPPAAPVGQGFSPPRYVRHGPAAAAPDKPAGVEELQRTEWLLTGGNGGFAMGTALGAPTRRYHGLLVASLRPPVQRLMALSAFAETLVLAPGAANEQKTDLANFVFRPGVLHPPGHAHLVRFEKDVGVRWHYKVGSATVSKQVHLMHDAPSVAVRYVVDTGGRAARLVLRPLVALRDFHGLNLRDTVSGRFRVAPRSSATVGAGCVVAGPGAALHLTCDCSWGGSAEFTADEQWWYDFQYDHERDRGYDYLEDLFHPGAFTINIPSGAGKVTATIHASLNGPDARDIDADERHRRMRIGGLVKQARQTLGGAEPTDDLVRLIAASDDYVVRRVAPPAGPLAGTGDRATIIAGYPWFADWGRDSMISLPGLLLCTRRFEEARQVLKTFADHRSGGLIPNVFDDYTGEPHYNTVDASLWFIHAACCYLAASGDALSFNKDLLPACLDVVAQYRAGTRHHIGMDPADGLIYAGDHTTQLTWMDAKRDGIAFTPRPGKAVEINALWYNALAHLATVATGVPGAADLAALRDKVGASFRKVFWNAELGCLVDHLVSEHGGWNPQREVRPNQVFAASLPHSALEPAQARSVVAYAKSRLLTPQAVRTLDPADSRYKGRYGGRMFERDSAYHNGTSWPWLLGPLAEAALRVGGFTPGARADARAILAGALRWLDRDCPGHLPEVFDGDDTPQEPQRPNGCPAQAWSVAEVLRVLMLVEGK